LKKTIYAVAAWLQFQPKPTLPAQVIPSITTDPAIGGRCLDVPNSNFTAGVRVITYGCQRSPNQAFAHDPNTKTVKAGNLCLDAFRPGGGASQAGDPVGLWTCHGGANQKWEPRQTANGHTMIVNLGDGRGALCLDVANGLNQNGAQLVLWSCQQSPNQFFEIHGVYRLLTPGAR
jgi:hypothetical protein